MNRPLMLLFDVFFASICQLALLMGIAIAQVDADGATIVTQPERTLEQVRAAGAEIAPVHYAPPAGRWKNLPRTAAILGNGEPELRVVMLGDSIVNDTSRSRWDDLLAEKYPRTKIRKITSVRGSTGCTWYKEPGRVQHFVLDQKPDLLIIGGISQNGDIDSIRAVIEQVRKGSPCDVLLMTGAFGETDPRDDKQWQFAIDPAGDDYRARLKRLAGEQNAGFLDMTGPWGAYIRASDQPLEWYKRDPIHANERGEQILGQILLQHLAPPVAIDSARQ